MLLWWEIDYAPEEQDGLDSQQRTIVRPVSALQTWNRLPFLQSQIHPPSRPEMSHLAGWHHQKTCHILCQCQHKHLHDEALQDTCNQSPSSSVSGHLVSWLYRSLPRTIAYELACRNVLKSITNRRSWLTLNFAWWQEQALHEKQLEIVHENRLGMENCYKCWGSLEGTWRSLHVQQAWAMRCRRLASLEIPEPPWHDIAHHRKNGIPKLDGTSSTWLLRSLGALTISLSYMSGV